MSAREQHLLSTTVKEEASTEKSMTCLAWMSIRDNRNKTRPQSVVGHADCEKHSGSYWQPRPKRKRQKHLGISTRFAFFLVEDPLCSFVKECQHQGTDERKQAGYGSWGRKRNDVHVNLSQMVRLKFNQQWRGRQMKKRTHKCKVCKSGSTKK